MNLEERSDKERALCVWVWLSLDCPGSLGAVGARPVAAKWDVYRTQVKRVKRIFCVCIM